MSRYALKASMAGIALAGFVSAAKAEEPTIESLKAEIGNLQKQQKAQEQELQQKLKTLEKTVRSDHDAVVNAPYLAYSGAERETAGTMGVKKAAAAVPGVKITFGGFLEAAGIYRSKDMVADIGTPFQKIPFDINSQAHTNEFRGTARQSRVQALIEGDIDAHQHLAAFVAADFLGAAPTANSVESNSYQPRLREYYATYDDSLSGWHFLAGQSWSLVTMFKEGLTARKESVPLTIDAQYVPGFDWLRNPEIRIVKDWDKRVWFGLEASSPQAIVAGTAPVINGSTPIASFDCVSQLANGGLNPGQSNVPSGSGSVGPSTCSDDFMPDITAKLAFDPGWGHFEVFGLARGFRDRIRDVGNDTTVAFSGGGGMILPLAGPRLQLQANVLAGQGIGRYTSSQLPDFTFNPDGSVAPLTGVSFMVGLTGKPMKDVDAYVYGGEDKVLDHFAGTTGYGNPAIINNTGCDIEFSAAGTCTANLQSVWQVTAGFWQKLYDGDKGVVQWGPQYSYTVDKTFAGAGGAPSTSLNVGMLSFRYYPKFGSLVGNAQ